MLIVDIYEKLIRRTIIKYSLFILLIVFHFTYCYSQKNTDWIKRLNEPELLTFEQAVSGIEVPRNILNKLSIIQVEYYGYDNQYHYGQMVVSKELENEIKAIFQILAEKKFPIEKIYPIVRYDWSDELS